MLFGMNFTPDIYGQTAVRLYSPPKDGVPGRFPPVPPGMVACASIRPPAADVAAGKLDPQLSAWMVQAPPRSLMAAWHEANDPSENQDAAAIKAMHEHMIPLAASLGVHYGAIAGTYPVAHGTQQLSDWLPPRLPWVGFDGYQMNPAQEPGDVFGRATWQIRSFSPESKLLITETNVISAKLAEGQVNWLHSALDYAIAENFAGFLCYESPGSTRSPSIPSSLLSSLAVRAATADLGGGRV
jgi:hypothetical protein